MDGFTGLILFVFGILSIILFFKVWGMCNKVKEIKEILEKNNQSKVKRYHYIYDTSIEALRSEEALIQELAFCKKYDEAQLAFNRLQFHLEKAKEHCKKFGYSAESQMRTELEIYKQIEEAIKQWEENNE